LEQYFIEMLNPYVKKWKNKRDLDTVKIINKQLKENSKENKLYIPKYIPYLAEEKDKEKLHKVLIVDYIQNYPNSENENWKLTDNISKCFEIIGLFLMSFLLALSVIMVFISVSLLLLEIFTSSSGGSLKECVINLIKSLFIFVVVVIMIRTIKISEIDDFSLEEQKIKKNIEKKVKYYDKKSSKYYF
ncbi:MAG: hypothetical protein K2N51_15465, partial [Lachnospiraceae bacterium]|nr:hypothetical protein [Lachnospiraceae bacterium]